MLSQDHLPSTSSHIQHHDQDRMKDESKAVARELLTSETDIFHVGPLSVFEDIIEDILAGKDQAHSARPTSTFPCHEDIGREQHDDMENDSDSPSGAPRSRRRDSIMSPGQVAIPTHVGLKQVVAEEEETAAQKVFGTYELLERIMLSLATLTEETPLFDNIGGLTTILLAQRLNKTFHHVIERSTKLQEKLFFNYKATKRAEPDHVTWNPLLQHPVLLDRNGFIVVETPGQILEIYLSIPTSYRGEQRNGRESWRRMLICQGETLQLYAYPAAPEHEAWKCDWFVVGPKTTMGELWDKIVAWREWTLQ